MDFLPLPHMLFTTQNALPGKLSLVSPAMKSALYSRPCLGLDFCVISPYLQSPHTSCAPVKNQSPETRYLIVLGTQC